MKFFNIPSIISFFIILLALSISCSRAEPTITFGFISLVYHQDKDSDNFVERYTFFVIPDDEDGLENLEDLYLYHDGEQLRWHLKSSDWIKFSKDDKEWIGSRSISIQDGENLPRGRFRAVIINKGGERSSRDFIFDGPQEPRLPFPAFEINDGFYAVRSAYPDNHLLFYNDRGENIFTIKLTALEGQLSSLVYPSNARSVALWAEDTEHFTSVVTDAISLR